MIKDERGFPEVRRGNGLENRVDPNAETDLSLIFFLLMHPARIKSRLIRGINQMKMFSRNCKIGDADIFSSGLIILPKPYVRLLPSSGQSE